MARAGKRASSWAMKRVRLGFLSANAASVACLWQRWSLSRRSYQATCFLC
jgi:hypothetical protein